MGKHITPTSREILLDEQDFIVSKTCTKGKITYANRKFMEIAGFTEDQLLGQPHNMIRHPDMPKGVFRLMWQTLKQENEFLGFVKNLCADGSFYWVFANVTPDLDQNKQVKGFYSVRRKASSDVINQIITPLYQEMLRIESQGSGSPVIDQSVNHLSEWVRQKDMDYNRTMIELFESGQ